MSTSMDESSWSIGDICFFIPRGDDGVTKVQLLKVKQVHTNPAPPNAASIQSFVETEPEVSKAGVSPKCLYGKVAPNSSVQEVAIAFLRLLNEPVLKNVFVHNPKVMFASLLCSYCPVAMSETDQPKKIVVRKPSSQEANWSVEFNDEVIRDISLSELMTVLKTK